MRKLILSNILTFMITLLFIVGYQNVSASVQSSNPRGDLVTGFRQDVNNINTSFDGFTAHSSYFVSANITFTSSDISGSNITSPVTFTFSDVNQARIDLADIITKVKNGGTISVGQWANVLKIK